MSILVVMTEYGLPDHEADEKEVVLPSGSSFRVHQKEEGYFNKVVSRYMTDNAYTNISDLQDLDRVVIGEVLIWRWGHWIMSNVNYWNDPVDELTLQKQIKDISQEIRQVKASLGMDKVSRDKAKGTDSVNAYLSNLRRRALLFKHKRNEEFDKALETYHELRAKLTLSDNSTPDEQKEFKCTRDDIWKWLLEEAFPAFDEIDRKFRQEGDDPQAKWVSEM